MKYEIGNLWDYHERGAWIVIPTNMAVNTKNHAIMGAGLALQAKQRYPKIPRLYGANIIQSIDNGFCLFRLERLIMLPTKYRHSLNSDLSLIEEGVKTLLKVSRLSPLNLAPQIALPQIGCGLGNLDWDSQVKPLVEKYLTDPRFVVVSPKGDF